MYIKLFLLQVSLSLLLVSLSSLPDFCWLLSAPHSSPETSYSFPESPGSSSHSPLSFVTVKNKTKILF